MNDALIQHNIQVLKQLDLLMEAAQKVVITDEIVFSIREAVLHDFISHLIAEDIYIEKLC